MSNSGAKFKSSTIRVRTETSTARREMDERRGKGGKGIAAHDPERGDPPRVVISGGGLLKKKNTNKPGNKSQGMVKIYAISKGCR